MNRVAIFCDGAYLDTIRRDLLNSSGSPAIAPSIDYDKLIAELSGTDELFGTYYYNATQFPSWKDNPFFFKLSFTPKLEMRIGTLKSRVINGVKFTKQKRVDSYLVMDMTTHILYKKVDRIILVAGDDDFTPVVQLASKSGIQVTVYYGDTDSAKVSYDLLDWAYNSVRITKEWMETLIVSNPNFKSEQQSTLTGLYQ